MKRVHGIVLSGLIVALVGCGPLGPLPGGRLSGQVSSPPANWSKIEVHEKNVQLETRPEDPYSVNVWGAGIGDRFYVASGRGGEAQWAKNLIEDPAVRLRVDGTLYEMSATRAESEEERQSFLDAVKSRYDWEPSGDEADEAWLFRLDPR